MVKHSTDPQFSQTTALPGDVISPVPKDLGVPPMQGEEVIEVAHDSLTGMDSLGSVNVPVGETATDKSEAAELSRLGRTLRVAKRAVQETVIHLEVNPLTNGPIRLAVSGATLKATGNPYLAAVAYGASTVALEGSAGVATADVLSSDDKESKTLNIIKKGLHHKSVQRFVVTKDGKLLPVAEALLAVYTGTSIVMTAKEGEEEAEKRTHLDRRKYGLKTAGIVGAICTAQAMLAAAGLDNYQDPKIVAPVVATAVGGYFGVRKIKNKVMQEREAQESMPRYDLSPEEMTRLEGELIAEVDKRTKKRLFRKNPGIYGIWTDGSNKYSNIARTNEANYFPEVKELSGEAEDDTLFLTLVDTRKGTRRVVHAATISGVTAQAEKDRATGKTGFITIDQLIEKGNFTADEFREYYESKGIDVNNSGSVDTNFRIGPKVELNGIKSGDLAYLTLLQFMQRQAEVAKGGVAVFASINQASIDSFKALGLKCELLMGRDDFVTPESEQGKEFHPVAIKIDDAIKKLFEGIDQVPEIVLT